ncbi:uncharacterized protein [Dysidea avara]|uniref:uncharacterized protein n=1 Tax=Dysidea avara TaxID=196820 RepID=UPI003322C9E1
MTGQGEFSLYSTDTEEQVSSAYRGLNRCASLLATLLNSESSCDTVTATNQNKEKLNNKKESRHHPIVPHSTGNNVTTTGDQSNKKTSQHTTKNSVQFYQPPRVASKRHPPSRRTRLRTKSAPKRTTDIKPSSRETTEINSADKQPRKYPKSFPASTSKYLTLPVTSSIAVSVQNTSSTMTIPSTTNTTVSTGVKVGDGCSNTVTVSSAAVNPVTSSSTGVTPLVRSTSSAPPPLHHYTNTDPFYIPPYHHHYPVHNGYPYPSYPVVPYRYSPVPVYVAEVTRRYNEMYGHYNPSHYGSTHYRHPQLYHHHIGGATVCDTATQVSSADHEDKRNKLSGEEDKVGNGIMKDEVDDSVASTTKRLVVVKDLVGLLKKRLNDCTVDGVSDLVEELEKVLSSEEPSLRTNLLHVDTLWSMQSPTSAADWLARLQMKEKEKKELEKKLQDDQQECFKLTTQLEQNSDSMECLRKHVDVLKAAQLVSEEELKISTNKISELSLQNSKLAQQLEESSHELSNKDDEIAKIQLQLQGVTNRLDEVEEEYQMLKLSVKRKEEELVTALDKNLGYQQCIASVVTNLVGNKLPGGVGYRVDEGTMQQLQVLLQDGNVDKFLKLSTTQIVDLTTDSQDLTGVTQLTLTPPRRTSSICNDHIAGVNHHRLVAGHGLSCSLVHSHSSSELPQEVQSLGGCDQSSCDTSSKITRSDHTSLTAASEVEFRNNLAILDANIAKLQLQFQIAKSSSC